MRILTFNQWATENGKVTTADVDSHIHAGLRSAPQTKAFKKFYETKLKELMDARMHALVEYQELIKNGSIKELTKDEKLILTANGHEDNIATHAARRICAKRGLDWKNAKI